MKIFTVTIKVNEDYTADELKEVLEKALPIAKPEVEVTEGLKQQVSSRIKEERE